MAEPKFQTDSNPINESSKKPGLSEFSVDIEEGPRSSADLEKLRTLEKETGIPAADIDLDAPVSDIVGWEGEDDPSKPMNWPNSRKAKNIIVICYCTFLTPLGSTMFAPAIQQVMLTFKSSDPLLASFVVSVWVLGYFFGPLVLGPLSEMYGRFWVYVVCNILFTIANVATALSPNLSALIVFRFFAGSFGGSPITLGAGTFGDLIRHENRGKVIAIWSLGPLLGPILGPIAGGYMGESVGWRWICWVMSIAAGIGAVASYIFQDETYPPILLDRKVARLKKETGNQNLRTALEVERNATHVFARSIIRPLRLLFLSPIVSILSIYQGIIYGYLYLLFTTFPLVFGEQYHFSTGTIGLTYLGMGVGALLGIGIGGVISDRLLKKLANQGAYKPEYRLPPLIPACFFIPVGLFWYGWSAQAKTHWIVPLLGTCVMGIGVNILMMCIATYFIDAHPLYEASALAASTSVRSLIGALVPLAGRSMYEALGLGWGNSLLGFLALAMCPLPWLFYRYGERIRTDPRFQLKL
ncbi:membrane transporter [Lophiostoma macrostomum CBS 122681]|uniref:Membrane transporter n=1 Tax=Lophiostoma macrostomum CBS 122681 TaxID=1314788 RepID=A0A6A6TKK1_9PLEO|nr:membrane transporter [Lophiostoma macrostomum CBS 122681]